MMLKDLSRLTAPFALGLGLAACGKDSTSPSSESDSVADYVASAAVDDAAGVLQTAPIPRPTADGPEINATGHLTIVNGGTATLHVSSPTPFKTVYVAGSKPVSPLFVPVSGFFEITLPSPISSEDLLITFPQTLPSGDFDLYIAVSDADGNIGTMTEKRFHALTVGTGDIQVTASWDTDSDVDLHVVDPEGAEIYWADRTSPSGGELDLDSNAACAGDNVRNENITWAVGTAPQGTYTVRLDYWSSCDAPETNYTVLINNGGDVAIYHGTFTGPGDGGGFGSGVLINTFTRGTGPAAAYRPNGPKPHASKTLN